MTLPTPRLLLLAALLLPACGTSGGTENALVPVPSAHPEHVTLALPVTGGTREVQVELAVCELERNQGLMNRTSLAPDAGMLFVFPDSGPRRFWMKNTLLPLDIIFLDDDGTVQNVAKAQPGVEEPGYHSLRPARMVLELNQGWCDAHGLRPGAKIPIPAELLALPKG